MTLRVVVSLFAVFSLSLQAPANEKCTCELTNSEAAFPHNKLRNVAGDATNCNKNVTPRKAHELEALLLGLGRRLYQLNKDVTTLEREDDGELYGVISLHVIENEMVEIKLLMERLNRTTQEQENLAINATLQVMELKAEMQNLEKFDSMGVVQERRANKRLTTDLVICKSKLNATVAPTQIPQGTCPRGQLRNITGPIIYTQGEYPGQWAYGAWGRDPKPEAGQEKWYWRVMLTSSDKYAHYVRRYSSQSALIVGKSAPGNVQISPSNPTTNTIQGPNVVLYGGALYYNCYNQDAVCRFNLTSQTVTTVQLPKGTRYNGKAEFCNMDDCYKHSDLDLATDESGVWVIYTTSQDYGNLVLSKVEDGEPPTLNQTWRTPIYKKGVSNTFVACGILYVTRYVNRNEEEVFFSLDTATGKMRFDLNIIVKKMSPNIQSLNYSPVDQMLHVYSDTHMVSYKAVFG